MEEEIMEYFIQFITAWWSWSRQSFGCTTSTYFCQQCCWVWCASWARLEFTTWRSKCPRKPLRRLLRRPSSNWIGLLKVTCFAKHIFSRWSLRYACVPPYFLQPIILLLYHITLFASLILALSIYEWSDISSFTFNYKWCMSCPPLWIGRLIKTKELCRKA